MSNASGLGTDIIEIERIAHAIRRSGSRFLKRLFTENEIAYCHKFKDPHPSLAARFAAKEAVAKALGTGIGHPALSWLDIEIGHDSSGKPLVHLSNRSAEAFGNPTILLSISHCRSYATATAIVFKKTREN